MYIENDKYVKIIYWVLTPVRGSIFFSVHIFWIAKNGTFCVILKAWVDLDFLPHSKRGGV